MSTNKDILKKFIGESLKEDMGVSSKSKPGWHPGDKDAKFRSDIGSMKSAPGWNPGQKKPDQGQAPESGGGDVSDSPFLDQEFMRGAGQLLMNPNMQNRLDRVVGRDKINSVMKIVKAVHDGDKSGDPMNTKGDFAQNFGQIVMKHRNQFDQHLGKGLIDKIFGALYQDYKSRK